MNYQLPIRILSEFRGINADRTCAKIPSFEEVQGMSVKELLSVPGIERLVSIKLVDFYTRFINLEGIIDLVSALTMMPLRMDGDSIKLDKEIIDSNGYNENATEARNALLIIKASESIKNKGTGDSLFKAFISPDSIFLDTVLLAFDHITETVMAADCLKNRSAAIEEHINRIDAVILLLEFLASVPAGFEVLMHKITSRYRYPVTEDDQDSGSCGRANPFFYLIDIPYVNTLIISLLTKPPSFSDSATNRIISFLETTHFADHCIFHLLSRELSALCCHNFTTHNMDLYPLPATFLDSCNSLSKGAVMSEQEVRELQKQTEEYKFLCSDLSTSVNEDVVKHAVELLCHVLASGNIVLIIHIIQYMPMAAEILFSPPLSCALSLHRLRLLSMFVSICVSMILRVPRLYMHTSAYIREASTNQQSQENEASPQIPLHTIIYQLGCIYNSTSTENNNCLRNVSIDPNLLPPEVNTDLIPVYNAYIAFLTHFIQDQMPKAVSYRTDTFYLARIAIIMRHIAGMFCILDEICRALSTTSTIKQNRRSYGEVYTPMQEIMYDYLRCGLIPETGTIISTCPEDIRLCESYIVEGRILIPSPLSIFAIMFPPEMSGKNPLLTLQLMLFNLKTGGKTVIKHYSARILVSVFKFAADSTDLFKRVITNIKLSAFLPSISKRPNRNPFCNLICEALLRICMKYDDIKWEMHKENLAGFYDNSFDDLGTVYPLSLSNHLTHSSILPSTSDTDQASLLNILIACPGIVAYVQNVLEEEHNRCIRIRDGS